MALWVEACLCRGQAAPPLEVGLAAQCHLGPVRVLPPLVEDSPLAQVAPLLVAPLPDLVRAPPPKHSSSTVGWHLHSNKKRYYFIIIL